MSNILQKCPQCGAPLPENAPAGLCPNCLMALNLKTETVFTDDSPAAQPPLPPEQITPHFPQLEILECLGRGGMGVVYKARQKTLNRLVALKLLAPERVRDMKFAERFTREAHALAALNHPNIVTIYDFGQAGGFYFLLMEFVDGANLRQLLRARKFTPEEALAIVPPLCDALQFAHERGIVHRDIKPENLLLDKTGRVKVADFGIAKMLGATNGDKENKTAAPENATQNAVGTPGYSAPEQKTDPQRVDSRADIYSLGAVFYEMLTGELPGKRIEPPSKKVQIDVRLDAVVLRALEKPPELRWQTASDLRTQVETIASDLQPSASPSGMKCYKNSQWNFELDIPKGWKILPPVPANSPSEVVRIASDENGNHILIIFRNLHRPGQSLNERSNQAQQKLAGNGFGNFASAETAIGSKAALMLDFDKPQGGGTWSCRHYFIADEVLAYTLGFGTTNKAGMFELFDRMAKSFEFQRPGEVMTMGETISKSSHPEISPRKEIATAGLNRMRLQIVIWGFALAAAGCSMNFVFGILGALLFVASAALALVFGDSLKKLQIAKRLVSIDGIVMASGGIWFAFNSQTLPTPWLVTIVAGCLIGIGYCVSCLTKSCTVTAAIQNPLPTPTARQQRLKKFFFVQLPVAFVIAMVIRTFFLQPFRAATDSAAPEIPRGSHFLVWKLAHNFAPGDLIAYRQEGWAYVGRVARNEGGVVSVNRNGRSDIAVPPGDILGRVISVYWRAANDAASGVVLQPSNHTETSVNGTDTRMTAKGVPLGALISYAYGPPTVYLRRSGNRVILPAGVTDGKFDFSFKDSDRPQEALQAEIKKQLGLAAHREMREADVLVLTVSNPSVIGLAVTKGGNSSDSRPGPGRFEFANMPIGDLSDFLEYVLGKPVIDETGLSQKFSGSLQWNPQSDSTAELKEIQNALSNQLGLELVPSRQPIEFLVVEKVK